jgi:hypothetical protein
MIEIELSSGSPVRVDNDVDANALRPRGQIALRQDIWRAETHYNNID